MTLPIVLIVSLEEELVGDEELEEVGVPLEEAGVSLEAAGALLEEAGVSLEEAGAELEEAGALVETGAEDPAAELVAFLPPQAAKASKAPAAKIKTDVFLISKYSSLFKSYCKGKGIGVQRRNLTLTLFHVFFVPLLEGIGLTISPLLKKM